MKVVLIGSGNVATHLGNALYKAGHKIVQVYSRKSKNAKLLAKKLNAKSTDNYEDLQNADLYCILLPDDIIPAVAKKLANKINRETTVIHCSGAKTLSALRPFTHRGIIYPLQSFKKAKKVKFKEVPLIISASNKQTLRRIRKLSREISNRVYTFSQREKEVLHLAAVFANNFTNHMLTLSKQITDKNAIPFEVMLPIIRETFQRIQEIPPDEAQTGPAIRADLKSIKKHLKLLNKEAYLSVIYLQVTKSINPNLKL